MNLPAGMTIITGQPRYPGIKIHETRIIRLMEFSCTAARGTHVGGWTAKEIHQAILTIFEATADTEPPPKRVAKEVRCKRNTRPKPRFDQFRTVSTRWNGQ